MNSFMGQPNVIGFLIFIAGVWTLFWKGVALWRASKYEQRNWFIAFLLIILFINTLGILELIYLFKFSKKPLTLQEIKTWLGLMQPAGKDHKRKEK